MPGCWLINPPPESRAVQHHAGSSMVVLACLKAAYHNSFVSDISVWNIDPSHEGLRLRLFYSNGLITGILIMDGIVTLVELSS